MTARTERTGIAPGVMGMVLFIASEVMFFGGLLSAYFSVRAEHTAWPPDGTARPGVLVPALFTLVLVSSSVTQHRAAAQGRARAVVSARRWMGITLVLGAAFLGGQAWEWARLQDDGLTVATNVYGTLFFLLTGAHGLHVIGGLVMLAAVFTRLGRNEGRRIEGTLEAVTYYWHFVDAVWLVLFSSLYVPL